MMKIRYLADFSEAIPILAEWFTAEWGNLHPGNTVEGFRERLLLRANRDMLPMGIIGILEDDVIATATLKFREIDYAPDADYWLGSVYVRENQRGRGYGKEIVSAAEGLAVRKGLVPLYLYSPGKEVFYSRQGWVTIGDTQVGAKRVKVMRKTAEQIHGETTSKSVRCAAFEASDA